MLRPGGDLRMATNWRRRRLTQAVWDICSWILAVPLAAILRYDFEPSGGVLKVAILGGVIAALLQIVLGLMFHLYQGRYIVGSFDEVFGVVMTTIAIGGAGTLLVLVAPPSELPRSTFVIASGIAAALMLGARFSWRAARRQSALSRSGKRTLIYGAGDAGSQLVQLMLADRAHEFQPVGFIDDDPSKNHLRRAGVRVIGTSDDLEDLIREYSVDNLLVAIAGVTADRLLELDRRCQPLGVLVRVIPTASEIVGGAVRLGDISDVTEEDLMGRRPIKTDEPRITEFIEGRRILVTGAGGSIGSELVRQLARYRPAYLALLDRDESALHAVQMTLDGSGNLTADTLLLADIRDQTRIEQIMSEVSPQIVFHAAALKHLPLLERFPAEAQKTNVLGTQNVLAAARKSGVEVFVNVSTDKAADPTSILGHSKLITERLTAAAGQQSGLRYMSVRFGNVLGSRGSVIEAFRFQIAKGGPVTVTHEEVTRYFMTVSEAVHLVLQAAVLGRQSETLILDMGTPVRILDIANYMIQRSGRDISVIFTGLRPGEKLDETLVGTGESVSRPEHPLISHTNVAPLNEISLKGEFSDAEAREYLQTASTVG